MKNLMISLSMFVCLTAQSFAFTVNSSKALDLRAALIGAGSEVFQEIEMSVLEVKNLTCVEEGGFVLLPLKCHFEDVNSTELKEVMGNKAQKLNAALLKSGLKTTSYRAGELSRISLNAKSIKCTTSFFAGKSYDSCTIQ
jgi:hypothetical protein